MRRKTGSRNLKTMHYTLYTARNLLLPVGVTAERQRAKFIVRVYRADGLPRSDHEHNKLDGVSPPLVIHHPCKDVATQKSL